jgi:ParB family chromosome partitioning protein
MAKPTMNLKQFAGVVQGATQRGGDTNISIDLIDVERQVRTQFDAERQESMNASIAAQGIHQSLVLLAKPDGRYRLIAGEYRYRGAMANNLKEVPARVRHNLSDWEIRRIQVSENLERTDISAFDEAMGVAEDVEKFGFATAREIWNRSESWISKRTAVLKYAPPVRQLLEDRICNDLELAHSLNVIHEMAEQEFSRLEKRMREGLPVTREEARAKVHQVKEWKNETKQRDARRQTLAQGPAAKGKGSADAEPGQKATAKEVSTDKGAASNAATPVAAGLQADASASHASAPQSSGAGSSSNKAVATGATPGVSQEQVVILEQMVTLFRNGVLNHGLIKDVQEELATMGTNMHQTDWAMWSLYQTVMLPLLAALGETRAQRYLQRTISELRNAKPQALWSQLHPTMDGKPSDDWSAPRNPVAPMPKDWNF